VHVIRNSTIDPPDVGGSTDHIFLPITHNMESIARDEPEVFAALSPAAF